MKQKTNLGFTLIELLLVIAIIALLSSIVLSSLRSARTKADDSKIVSQLTEMRKAAELANVNGIYGTASGNNNCGSALNSAFSNNGFNTDSNWPAINGVASLYTCYSSAQDGAEIKHFSVWHPMSDSQGWCVDSAGNSVSRADAPGSSNCTESGGGDGEEETTYTLNFTCDGCDGGQYGEYYIDNPGPYSLNDRITIIATPNNNTTYGDFAVVNWGGCDELGSSNSEFGNNICYVTMSENITPVGLYFSDSFFNNL